MNEHLFGLQPLTPQVFQRHWKNQLLGREAPLSLKRQNESKPVPEQTELQQQVESLQRDIQRLRLERDLLKNANELLKKAWVSICSS